MTSLDDLFENSCTHAVLVKWPQDTDRHIQTNNMLMLPPWLLFQNAAGILYSRTVTNPDNMSLVTTPPPSFPNPEVFQWQTDKTPLWQGIWHLYILEHNIKSSSSCLEKCSHADGNKELDCITDCLISQSNLTLNAKKKQKPSCMNDKDLLSKERRREKSRARKAQERGKETGIYFHLSTALKDINTYKDCAYRALGQYWSVYVCLRVMDDSAHLCSLSSGY